MSAFYSDFHSNVCYCSIKAQCCYESVVKVSKETSQKYQQLLEVKKEYVVEELLDVRQSNDGELEFLTK